jgi:hypothetical protein
MYGGSGTRRHLLSKVNINLTRFLILKDNLYINPEIIHKSFNDINMSSKLYDFRDLVKNYLSYDELKNNNYDMILMYNIILKYNMNILKIEYELRILINAINNIYNNFIKNIEVINKYSDNNEFMFDIKFTEDKIVLNNEEYSVNNKYFNERVEKLNILLNNYYYEISELGFDKKNFIDYINKKNFLKYEIFIDEDGFIKSKLDKNDNNIENFIEKKDISIKKR